MDMNAGTKNLSDILALQRDVYKQVLDTERKKTEIMMNGDAQALDNIINSEQSMIMRINSLEAKRISAQNSLGCGTLTLMQLVQKMKEEQNGGQAEILSLLHGELTELLSDIKQVNKLNMGLINAKLEFIDEFMAEVGMARESTGTYTHSRNMRDDKDTSTMFKRI